MGHLDIRRSISARAIWKFGPALAIYSMDARVSRLLADICAAVPCGGTLGGWVFFEYDVPTGIRIAIDWRGAVRAWANSRS